MRTPGIGCGRALERPGRTLHVIVVKIEIPEPAVRDRLIRLARKHGLEFSARLLTSIGHVHVQVGEFSVHVDAIESARGVYRLGGVNRHLEP